MDKKQALNILADLAFSAELPKALTVKEASQYINQIQEAKKVLESVIIDKPKKEPK